MLEKKALKDREAASARQADISLERERQRAVLAAQVRPHSTSHVKRKCQMLKQLQPHYH